MDNAIENCTDEYQKNIKMSIGRVSEYLFIKVENTIIDSVLKDNPQLITAKDDSKHHGIGLKNVKLLINQYKGDISFQEKNNYFIVRILLPTTK